MSSWSSRQLAAARDVLRFKSRVVPAGPHFVEHTHRDVRGGGLRAAVFGVSDGLVSNVSLVLGTVGAHPGAGIVRLAGLAGLFGGSFSMAAGEYISMRVQKEAFERELHVEKEEIETRPESERAELVYLYESRGLDTATVEKIADTLMADPRIALETHAREELGLDPTALGSPIQAALFSFVTFAVACAYPAGRLPWRVVGVRRDLDCHRGHCRFRSHRRWRGLVPHEPLDRRLGDAVAPRVRGSRGDHLWHRRRGRRGPAG